VERGRQQAEEAQQQDDVAAQAGQAHVEHGNASPGGRSV